MEPIRLTIAAATFGFILQPAAACEKEGEAFQATPITTAALQVVPAAAESPSGLPSIDSLTADSDFTVFMQPGVPSAKRTAALRKLWRSNPIFSRSDGLDADVVDHR